MLNPLTMGEGMSAVPAQAVPTMPTAIAAERGMRFMLIVLVAFVAISDVFDLQLSLAPGLSAKNALLYMLAAGLAFKLAMRVRFELELRMVHACFVVLIVYAIMSMLAAALLINYPRYELVHSAINLKSRLIDQAIFFLVFFYALRESRNAYFLAKMILIAAAFANLAAVLDAWGVIHIGGLEERADGRMQGVMGESNQYAAFISFFLPALVAMVLQSRGIRRIAWLLGLLITTGAVIMAVSRGAFVAIVASAIWGGWLLRHRLSASKVIGVAGAATLIFVIAIAVLSVRYGDLLYNRVFGDSSSSDLVGASSGRTEIWTTAIARMTQSPLSLITGFGWDVYWSMPFRYSPHNHYVSLWFNLGLVGLACGVALLVQVVRQARAAFDRATPEFQPLLGAFVVGALAISIAAFFVDLYTPWLWFWAYTGLIMRIAVNAQRAEHVKATPAQREEESFGWAARSQGVRAR